MNLSLPPATGGTQATPESDSFSYMETILESLAVLGKLGVALEMVTQRLPTEIHNLVANTISEVSERVESASRLSTLGPTMDSSRGSGGVFMSIGGNSGALRLAALELSVKENSREVLRDLFWTLYSKLDAVVQGFRVISEVSNRIGSVCLNNLPSWNTAHDICRDERSKMHPVLPQGLSSRLRNNGCLCRPRFGAYFRII